MVLKLLLALLISSPAQAFVLLSGPTEARLDIAEDRPKIIFQLSMDPPSITNKDEFREGAYADLSDQDFWLTLVQLAMKPWNDVADSYAELDVEFSSEATLDKEDRVFSIVVGKTNLTTAAYADPSMEGKLIVDCDIAVSERGSDAKFMAFTLMHELGHCLGLGHNHSDYSAVMGYSRTNRSLNLGLDDEAGLIYLYPAASVGKPKELATCGLVGAAGEGSGYCFLSYLIPAGISLVRRLRRRRD